MYTITLEDYPASLTEQAKLNAEFSFQRILERAPGEPETIITTYRSWQYAMESDESELSETDKRLAKKWLEVASKAHTEGLKELGECEAYFCLHIER